jgi:hypothetical protein
MTRLKGQGDGMTHTRPAPLHLAPIVGTSARDHAASSLCWCHPEQTYRDLATTAPAWLHRNPSTRVALDSTAGSPDGTASRPLPASRRGPRIIGLLARRRRSVTRPRPTLCTQLHNDRRPETAPVTGAATRSPAGPSAVSVAPTRSWALVTGGGGGVDPPERVKAPRGQLFTNECPCPSRVVHSHA